MTCHRSGLSILVAALVTCLTASVAEAQISISTAPPPGPGADGVRTGLTIGGSAGGASFEAGLDPSANVTSALGYARFEIGAFVTPRVVLLGVVDIAGASNGQGDLSDPTPPKGRTDARAYSVSVRYYPLPRLWVDAQLGRGAIDVTLQGGGNESVFRADGLVLGAGIGVELVQWSRVALGLNARAMWIDQTALPSAGLDLRWF